MNIRRYRWKTGQGWMLDARSMGQRVRKVFPTRQDAELYYKKLVRDERAELLDELLPDITFADFVKIYAEKKPWKTESYKTRVLSALGRCGGLAEVSVRHLRSAHAEGHRDQRLKKGIAPSTVRQDLAALRDLGKWAVKLRYLRANPFADVEKPSIGTKQDDPQRFIAKEDFYEKLLPEAGKDAPLWTFLAWTGLRITEALSLEWQDVADDHLIVRRGKGRKQRAVPLLEPAKDALAKIPKAPWGSQRVFWASSDRHACLRRFYRRCTKAGIGHFRLHDLRHTYGSWAAMAGVPIDVIAECMGHGSTTVTKLYAHLSPEYKRRQVEKMLAGKEWANALAKPGSEQGTQPS